MVDYGIWTMLPPISVIILAIWSRKPVESLLIGCLSSYAIIAAFTKQNFIQIASDAFFQVVTDYDNLWIIFVCGLFGSLIALLNESKSTYAMADFISKFCKSAKSVLMSAWALGIAIFIDDYMNVLTISSCMKQTCEKKRIPRAALAYVIDSTSAPTCVLIPFSTWAIFYASSFYEQEAVKSLGFKSAMDAYVHAIPYMLYAVVALIIVLMFIMGIIPKIGAMKKEFAKVELTYDNVFNDKSNEEKSGHLLDFIIPIGVMIVVTILGDDMFLALISSIISCAVLYIPRKIITLDKFCNLWVKGFGDLMPTLAVLLFAFYMKQACADINLPSYVVGKCLPYVTAKSFPVIAFVLVSILSFVTGDSWGVPAICIPIIIPLCAACNANVLLTMGAIVSGGVFCSHACFYSDTTVLTSSCCEIDNMTHARTQIPYAMIAFTISAIIYTILGVAM